MVALKTVTAILESDHDSVGFQAQSVEQKTPERAFAGSHRVVVGRQRQLEQGA
jgi:hypothetical protein